MDNYPEYPHATGKVVDLSHLDVHSFFAATPPEHWTPVSFMPFTDTQDMFDEFEAGLRKIHRAGGLDVHRFAGTCLAYVTSAAGHIFLREMQDQLDNAWATFQTTTEATLHAPWCVNDIKVEIVASDTGESFEGGTYEGRCAKTIRAPLQYLTEESVCVIKLIMDGEDEDEDDKVEEVVEKDEITLPVRYLRRVEPTRMGSSEKVVAGEHRGNIGKLLSLGAKGAVVHLRGGRFHIFRPEDLAEYVGYSS
ncbi:hypothetical protein BGZ74_004744 [Mortierella antarctica]|nr:hypothetical protein BGZ74_004744 [Mortierella antarctica]